MKIFDSIRIGNVDLKNRIVFPPLTTSFEDRGGIITEKSINFYRELARGGTGLIVVGDVGAVASFSKTPTLQSDDLIAGHKRLTDAVHKEGGKVCAQIYYPEVDPDIVMTEMRKSGMEEAMRQYHILFNEYVNQVDYDGIKKMQDKIVECAVRAKEAGYDMLQLHGDRIVGMFCSPILNKRDDEYGGSFENRSRFALEVVEKIKRRLPEMTLDYKLAIIRMEPRIGNGGPTLEEAKRLAKQLEALGVDSFHVCIANHGDVVDTIPPMGSTSMSCFLDLAEAIKKVVSVPVATVGRIIEPEVVREILSSNKADLISLGRQLVADPEWTKKVKEGREDEIRYCIMCNKGCTDTLLKRESIACVVNPTSGLEAEPEIIQASEVKEIAVIGGGIAGVEFARVATLRGHDVTIFEKEEELFGQVNIASVPPHKEELKRIKTFYLNELKRLGIRTVLKKEMTAELIKSLKCDEVILATGGKPIKPEFKGAEKMRVMSSWDVLDGSESVAGKVAVIGGGSVGVETAEYLAVNGCDVCIVEMASEIARDEGSMKPLIMKTLEKYNVRVEVNSKLKELNERGIIISKEDDDESIQCDAVVLAIGSKPHRELKHKLSDIGITVHTIGDCSGDKVGMISDAIRDGFNKALEV